MKKAFSVLAAFLLLVSFLISSYAESAATVFADSLDAKPGETVMIPVKIAGNPGLMGFKINIIYDGNILASPAALRGLATAGGLLNDSIKPGTTGSFSVLWSDTKNVTSDGTLFVLQFKVSENAESGSYSINLSYEQPDTFDENWKDIKLDCKNISVRVVPGTAIQTTAENTTVQAETTTQSVSPVTTAAAAISTANQNEMSTSPPGGIITATANQTTVQNVTGNSSNGIIIPENVDSEFIVAAVDTALRNLGAADISSLNYSQKQNFVKTVIGYINAFGAEKITVPEKNADVIIGDIETAYVSAKSDDYVKTTLNNVDGVRITSAVENKLNELGAKSMGELADNQKQEFVDSVTEQLNGYQADNKKNLNGIGIEKVLSVLSELYEKAKAENETIQAVSATAAAQNGKVEMSIPEIAAISAAVVFVLCLTAAAVWKKKRVNHNRSSAEEKTPEVSE